MKHTPLIFIGIALVITAVIFTMNGLNVTRPAIAPKPPINNSILSSSAPITQQESTTTHEVASRIQLPILMYHYIRTVTNPRDTVGIGLSVPPEIFDEQMKFLKDEGYTTVTLDDLTSVWKFGTPLPEKSIVLTFDDGYEDFYTAAFPILTKYNFKATIYIVTDFIDRPNYLTKTQLEEISQSPLITIGSHTQRHVNLQATSGTKLRDEIFESKTWLEKVTERPINHFCYPSGKYNQRAIQHVEAAGYTTATTTDPGMSHDGEYPFILRRVRVPGGISLKNFEKNLYQ